MQEHLYTRLIIYFLPKILQKDVPTLKTFNPSLNTNNDEISRRPWHAHRLEWFSPGAFFSYVGTVYRWVWSEDGSKADSYGNEKLIRKWTKSVFFIRDQKFGQADSYGNEKLIIRKWTKSTGLGAF